MIHALCLRSSEVARSQAPILGVQADALLTGVTNCERQVMLVWMSKYSLRAKAANSGLRQAAVFGRQTQAWQRAAQLSL